MSKTIETISQIDLELVRGGAGTGQTLQQDQADWEACRQWADDQKVGQAGWITRCNDKFMDNAYGKFPLDPSRRHRTPLF